jgi:hypothetical protein
MRFFERMRASLPRTLDSRWDQPDTWTINREGARLSEIAPEREEWGVLSPPFWHDICKHGAGPYALGKLPRAKSEWPAFEDGAVYAKGEIAAFCWADKRPVREAFLALPDDARFRDQPKPVRSSWRVSRVEAGAVATVT